MGRLGSVRKMFRLPFTIVSDRHMHALLFMWYIIINFGGIEIHLYPPYLILIISQTLKHPSSHLMNPIFRLALKIQDYLKEIQDYSSPLPLYSNLP